MTKQIIMKILIGIITSFGLGLLLFFSPASPSSSLTPKEQAILKAVFSQMEENHYHPKVLDDSFAAAAFQAYLAQLDPDKKLFTQNEFDQLSRRHTSLDDEVREGSLVFFEQVLSTWKKAVTRAEVILNEWKTISINIDQEEYLETDPDKRGYPADAQSQQSLWAKLIKQEVLRNMMVMKQEGDPDLSTATRQAFQAFDDQLSKWKAQDRKDHFSLFLNALLSVYGPHNSYLTPKEQENFDIQISRSLKGIGARLEQDEGYIRIIEVVPGGPAWKTKQLEAGDLVLKIQDAESAIIDLKGATVDEAVALFRGEVGTEARLTVRKPNGTIQTVSVIRDVINLEEGLARSALLSLPSSDQKFGIIRLSRFYFTRGETGNKCAEDVAEEIQKLKEEGVGGIIFDLRNNQGGSLFQTLEMIGFFIEKGPVVQREAKDQSVRVFSDKDSTVLFEGEVVVLVNERSASGSELFSATLQDYDRAVIVGSSASTYGKGTIQNIQNLDETEAADSSLMPLGNLKLTVAKFYRINGSSTQKKGVIPDLVLPGPHAFITTGEKTYTHALPSTTIEALDYQQGVNKNPNLEKVIVAGKMRLNKNKRFQIIRQYTQLQAEKAKQSRQLLTFKQFMTDQQERQAAQELLEGAYQASESITIKNLPQNQSFIESDPLRKSHNQEWLTTLSGDPYIEECAFLLRDLSTLR
jgi:carboxyl-terminal processing protease